MFNREELLEFHQTMTGRALELMKRKNHDYAGEGGQNPFANFTRCEALGICSTEQGMLVRLSDKLSRLATFAAAGRLLVADEGVTDTCDDMVNYAVLFAAWCAGKKRDGGTIDKVNATKFMALSYGDEFVTALKPDDGGLRHVCRKIHSSGEYNAVNLKTNDLMIFSTEDPVFLYRATKSTDPFEIRL